ncbi:hypothetical protein H1R20_g9078, partial [Candolleomyces eurysporus]
MASSNDQCALGPDGRLLPASQIIFYNDPDDPTTLPPVVDVDMWPAQDAPSRSRPQQSNAGNRMRQLICDEKLDDNNQLRLKFRDTQRTSKAARRTKAKASTVVDLEDTDGDDGDYSQSSEGEDEDEEEEEDREIENHELADILPAKTNPKGDRSATKRKSSSTASSVLGKKQRLDLTAATPRENGSPQPSPHQTSPSQISPQSLLSSISSSSSLPQPKATNPVYLFYKQVSTDRDGTSSPGTRYFQCHHGQRRIFKITTAMKHNTKHMVEHLRSSFPTMYNLYLCLKERKSPASDVEAAVASGSADSDEPRVQELLRSLKNRTQTIEQAFEQQTGNTWDQASFEQLLVEWIAACDQPFDKVEKPEFRCLLEYIHSPSRKALKIPHCSTIRRRLMKMGKDAVQSTKEMFAKLNTKVAISLDAWTLPNQHAFLAIVAHYVTADGELEELLIDFREIQGAHTGENLAEHVWNALEMYNLLSKVIAFVMDNATNNDTLVDAFERRCQAAQIPFSAADARLRCMPHIIHLAALQLLEGIGAIDPTELRTASPYQQDVAASLFADASDENLEGGDISSDLDSDETVSMDSSAMVEAPEAGPDSTTKLTWIEKVRRIVKAVRSSPQQRAAWIEEAAAMIRRQVASDPDAPKTALMLILDVRTRWSSTYQMLCRAIAFHSAIDNYTAKNRDLRSFELLDDDWAAAETVCSWLECFQSATRQMSATKTSMLSSTIAVFRGLQQQLKERIRMLPRNFSPEVRTALVNLHKKLSDYYFRFDTSPYRTWAALLDPRISYEGLKNAFADDTDLTNLETAKSNLEQHYRVHYERSTPVSCHTDTGSSAPSSLVFNFTSTFRRAP